ncbi:MAG: SIS domain-containing protein [Lachnospiraceae bacterium]|jgi:D-arabinose 5-phosphate isomerase GutQ|nr:SIS domain-containing protein [Lachnospiraceae bacterium]
MTTYFEKQLEEITRSIHSMDMKIFEKMVDMAVDILRGGHKIIVSGLGKNVPICDKFVGSMVSMGLDACFLHTNSAIHGDMGVVKDGDMVILLTKSGETVESIYLARLLKQRQTKLWLLTFENESTLTKEIPNHLIIKLNHEGDLWNIMPNNSTTINLIVLQGLAMKIADYLKLDLESFKRNHPGGNIGKILG